MPEADLPGLPSPGGSLPSAMSPRTPGTGLTKAQAQELSRAYRRAQDASREFTETIRVLVSKGVSVQAIAAELGMSRQAVYDRLKRHTARR
jgi:transcriptional regulator of acetoin/glycerol metabolism